MPVVIFVQPGERQTGLRRRWVFRRGPRGLPRHRFPDWTQAAKNRTAKLRRELPMRKPRRRVGIVGVVLGDHQFAGGQEAILIGVHLHKVGDFLGFPLPPFQEIDLPVPVGIAAAQLGRDLDADGRMWRGNIGLNFWVPIPGCPTPANPRIRRRSSPRSGLEIRPGPLRGRSPPRSSPPRLKPPNPPDRRPAGLEAAASLRPAALPPRSKPPRLRISSNRRPHFIAVKTAPVAAAVARPGRNGPGIGPSADRRTVRPRSAVNTTSWKILVSHHKFPQIFAVRFDLGGVVYPMAFSHSLDEDVFMKT